MLWMKEYPPTPKEEDFNESDRRLEEEKYDFVLFYHSIN